MGHHQKHYHQVKNFLMKYIDYSESCLLYQNHELFFRIPFIVWSNVRKEQWFFRINWNQVISMCLNCFSIFCQKFIRGCCTLVNTFERIKTKWFQFVRKINSLKIQCKTNEFIACGSSRLWEFCMVYAKDNNFLQCILIYFWLNLQHCQFNTENPSRDWFQHDAMKQRF